MDKKHLLN